MNRNRYSGWALGVVCASALVAALPVVRMANAVDRSTTFAQSVAPMGAVSFADVVETVSPAVVNIAVTKMAPVQPTMNLPGSQFPGGRGDGSLDDFFGRFFESPGAGLPERPQEARAVGSGFIIDPDGYVVTNDHVIADATEITVTLQDERQFQAHLVGQDPKTDLALLKIDIGSSMPFVELGDSDRIRVGDWVLAIGNPFGLGGTATVGIVSARGRDIQSGPYDDYLQIDAPINSGNSGGPVFDAMGQVVGVNTAIYSPSGGNVGIGFAIPSNQVNAVVSELRASGVVNRGWLGVQIQSLDEDLAAGLGLDSSDGALIADVTAESPAEKAGLETGDVVLALNGERIDSPRTLSRLVGDSDPNETARLEIWRNGARQTVRVTLGLSDAGSTAGALAGPADASSASKLGLTLTELTAAHRTQLGLPADLRGVLVSGVDRDSPAAKKGVQAGDVLLKINGSAVGSAAEVLLAVERAATESGQAVFLLRRGDSQRFVSVPVA